MDASVCSSLFFFLPQSIFAELRMLTGKKHLKLNSRAYEWEYGHLGRWYIKLTLFRGSKTETNFPKKQSSNWQNSTLCDRSIL